MKTLKIFAMAAMSLFIAGTAIAQTQQQAAQPLVDQISVKIEGSQNVSKEAILAHMKLRSGMQFDQKALDASIRSLYSTGLYDHVEAKKTLDIGGRMDIALKVVTRQRIGQVVFKGNKRYSASRLSDEIQTYSGAPLDEIKIKKDVDKLKEFYRKKGYSLAKIKYSVERNKETGLGAVIFDINEGGDIKIINILFEGSPQLEEEGSSFWTKALNMIQTKKEEKSAQIKVSADDLLGIMKTDTWIPVISYLTDNGRFKESELEDDIEKIKNYYRNLGYLDVEIDESKIRFEFPDADNPGDMNLIISINEGRQYKTGKITMKGNKLFDTDLLMQLLDIYEGDVFSPAKVDSSAESIRDYYGQYGYLDSIARMKRKPNLKTGAIDLEIEIVESERFYLESIYISGNEKTKSEVILRELALAPGEIFDLVRMKDSENRLKNTRFFDEVKLSPEASGIPNRRNLKITLKEGRTGNITFGAGFSTVENLVGTVELTQTNFDWRKYSNYFQGAGQKFRIRASIGLYSNQVIVSYEEPWVFNRELAFGTELFRTDSGYYSDYYSEVRLGATFYLRKRIYELIETRLSYTVEDVQIYDVSSDAPSFIKDEAGHRSISQVGLSFLRDNRDNYMMPTSGTRFELLQNIAGGPLMGQTNLYRLEGRAGWWIPTFEWGSQVLSFVGRAGTVMGYGNKDVPYFEKYFLGGGYNMRGFKYRKVGRLDSATKEPFGGDSFAYLSVEYSVEVFNPVRFAVFYDIGFVNANDWDWDPSDYNSDFGIGLRIVLMGAPMRIDLGFPMRTSEYNDNGMQFNFSFGTVF